MRGALSSKLLAGAARIAELRRDERGNVIIYVTVMSALLLGMAGLALDGSRGMITHSEAQAAADAAALAAASQLDGQAGACTRATNEASAVVNKQRFAEETSKTITVAATRCLSDLPASDSTDIPAGANASDSTSRYVQVTSQQLTHQNTLLAALATQNTSLIQRKATAGFRRSLCAPAPVMMVCDTASYTTGVAYDAWLSDASHKGWVSTCGNSAPCVQDTLASAQPSFCVVDDNIDPVPGNKTDKAQTGINTRFGTESTATAPSDLDITTFPHDTVAGTRGWNCDAYWTANHAGDGMAKPAGCSSNSTSLTRYDVYQAERAANHIPLAGTPAAGTATATAERRLIYIAIFNCASSGAPEGFLKAFMLEPAQGTSTKTQFVEVLGLATSKTDPLAIHEEVQLYR